MKNKRENNKESSEILLISEGAQKSDSKKISDIVTKLNCQQLRAGLQLHKYNNYLNHVQINELIQK